MEPYKSLLEVPGTRFVVKEKVPGVYEGTTGFISHYKGKVENDNIMRCSVVIVRRGKNGDPRLEFSEFLIPIFIFNKHSFREVMPKNIRHLITPVLENTPIPILELRPIEFAGWSTSVVNMLHLICTRGCGGVHCVGGNKQQNIWPVKNQLLNALHSARTHLDNIGVKAFEEEIANKEFRRKAIMSLRHLESKIVRRIITYSLKLVEHEARAAHWIGVHSKAGNMEGISTKRIHLTEIMAREKIIKIQHLIGQRASAIKQQHEV